MIPPLRFNKLPKFAQEEIFLLRQQLGERDETIRELRDLRDGDEATNVFIDHFRRDNTLLPKDSQISFSLPDGDRIDVRLDGDTIYVYGYTKRSAALAVYPLSSNTMRIGTVDR